MNEPRSDEAAQHPRAYTGADESLAVPVVIVKDETPEKVQSATFGGWQAFSFAGTEPAPVRVLRLDTRRRRAVLVCTPGAAANIVGNLWIGSQAQVSNGNPAINGAVPFVNGMSVTVESATDIWCIPDGVHSLTLVVLDEIYRD